MKFHLILFSLFVFTMTKAEPGSISTPTDDDLPYQEIPALPESYTPANVVARMIDGLGFRYYWTTEGLRPEDLQYKPSAEGRTTDETLDHIYELSLVIANVAKKIPNERKEEPALKLMFSEKRKRTLNNFKTASDIFKTTTEGLEAFNIKFTKDGETTESPFWNLINGMISDALWHTGQVVSFRRTSGNPIRKGINYFTGKVSK